MAPTMADKHTQVPAGTWLSNGKNIIVFDDAADTGSDARAYGISLSGANGQNLTISLKSAGRGANEETLELQMIFKK
jgi:hypothetical protein